MKHFLLYTFIFLAFPYSIYSQITEISKETPQITARVEKIVREDKDDWVIFEVDLMFELKNTLNKKLFILDNKFSLNGIEVFKSSHTNSTFESILRNQHPPSFSGNDKWLNIGEEIMSAGAESNFLTSLYPEESKFIEKKYSFGFPGEKYKAFTRSLSWDEIKDEKALFLRFDVSIWENEIRTKDVSRKEFPLELTPKIQNQGVFWFKKLTSELIPVDLNSTIVKMNTRP